MNQTKLLLVIKKTNYIIITDHEGGHTGQQAKKLLSGENVLVYIFKIPSVNYNGRFLKYL